jgi:DNA-binding transcriptional MerR regulator
LATRWKLSVATLQLWSAEGVGPPAWRIGKHPRYLEIEVEAFERQAQIRPKLDAGRSLSQCSLLAREDAIKNSARLWPAPRDLVLLSDDIVADVTGLPLHWFVHLRDRQRLGIPFYALGNASVIRFSLEDVFRWEMTQLVPRALPWVNVA